MRYRKCEERNPKPLMCHLFDQSRRHQGDEIHCKQYLDCARSDTSK